MTRGVGVPRPARASRAPRPDAMPREETVVDLIFSNPDLVVHILEFSNGVSCKEMARRCLTNKTFAVLCESDAFWKRQSQLRGYDRASRLNPFRRDPAPIGPIGGSWKEHYKWWCLRVHDNDSIRGAVRDLDFNTGVHANYGHISDWDVSQVTDMRGMFAKATSFNSDLSRWNVSQVTDMRGMFAEATSFTSDLSGWDVSEVTDMVYMFYRATSFTSDLSGWDVSQVTDMDSMFYGATSFNSDLSRWDVSQVNDMSLMFEHSGVTNPPNWFE